MIWLLAFIDSFIKIQQTCEHWVHSSSSVFGLASWLQRDSERASHLQRGLFNQITITCESVDNKSSYKDTLWDLQQRCLTTVPCTNQILVPFSSSISSTYSSSTGATWSSCFGDRRTVNSTVLSWAQTQKRCHLMTTGHWKPAGSPAVKVMYSNLHVHSQDFHHVPPEEALAQWLVLTDYLPTEAPSPLYPLYPAAQDSRRKQW